MAQAEGQNGRFGATRPYIVSPASRAPPRGHGGFTAPPAQLTRGDAQIEPRRIRSARVAVTVGTVRIQVGVGLLRPA